jgi:hypothetical protein
MSKMSIISLLGLGHLLLPVSPNMPNNSQGVEELRFKLTSLVGGDGLRATEAGYPAGQ